ncbi:phenylalanine--tRNA ligase subunit alpha [Polaromonas sp.]|nr:phenylalanine--tRNA ligase subunit alpha [Candidatus Saccharibacteria bacterium]
MNYQNEQIDETAKVLKNRLPELSNKADILKAVELKALYDQLRLLPNDEKAGFGAEVNTLRQELSALVSGQQVEDSELPAIDITAPFDLNIAVENRPRLLPSEQGTIHPLMSELAKILDIFYRMGFTAVESREIDDDFHMFGSLNFPENHPARDHYDTFMTEQTGSDGKSFIAPAHTSTMQHRVMKHYIEQLEQGTPIAAVIPGRVFRNEDLDARHEHTFYQVEGVYVAKDVHVGNLIATLKTFLQTYYGKTLEVKTQPFYFPFTEPSFEFALSCPFCDKAGCNICSQTGWIELLGCGMIHPNVLLQAGIDPEVYTGYAWGFGIERLVMMKHGIEDIRHFEAAKLDFLRQF